jgi:uncharacterized membrane protein
MEAAFKALAAAVNLGCEAAAVLVLGYAALEAVTGILVAAPRLRDVAAKRQIWVRFASWIVLSLEFALAADIAHTAIAPSWNDLGQLAAIAAIRTVLNLFLERDIAAFEKERMQSAPPPATRPESAGS